MKHLYTVVRITRNNRVVFGLKDDDARGIVAVILPQFDTSRCTLEALSKITALINGAKKMYKDSCAESVIKKSIGDMFTRLTIENGNLVALDEDAASMLLQMGFPIIKDRHYIPVWKEVGIKSGSVLRAVFLIFWKYSGILI